MDRDLGRLIRAVVAALWILPSVADALTVGEFRKLNPDMQAGYLIGVYDSSLIHAGPKSDCMQRIGGVKFINDLGAWLNPPAAAPEHDLRMKMDVAPMALVANLRMDELCKQSK